MDDYTPPMTPQQLDAGISAEIARLDRVEAIQTEAEQGRDYIVNFGHSDAIRDALLAEYDAATLTPAEDAHAKAADVAFANLEQILSQTALTAPVLTADEYAVANSRREDIRFDVEQLPYGDLVRAVQYAVMVNDRPAMHLFAKFVPPRLTRTDESWADDNADQAKSDLRRLVRDINDRLADKSLQPLADRAKAVRSRALAVERAAIRRKNERGAAHHRPLEQKFHFQSPGEITW